MSDPMAGLDVDQLRAFAAAGPKPVFAVVSGAHLYGFPSADSDVDLRGALVLPLEEVIGLREPGETWTSMRKEGGVELDWVAHDVRKTARLLVRRSGEVMEQVFSPLVVIGGTWLDELRELARGCIVRPLAHHYLGFARSRLKLLDGRRGTVKDLLYAYRVLLTGIHAMRAGAIEADLRVLASEYPVDVDLTGLLARKRAGDEHGKLADGESDAHLPHLRSLTDRLVAARDASQLPDAPTTLDGLHDYVIRVRRALGR